MRDADTSPHSAFGFPGSARMCSERLWRNVRERKSCKRINGQRYNHFRRNPPHYILYSQKENRILSARPLPTRQFSFFDFALALSSRAFRSSSANSIAPVVIAYASEVMARKSDVRTKRNSTTKMVK